jgi:hypothetical protein
MTDSFTIWEGSQEHVIRVGELAECMVRCPVSHREWGKVERLDPGRRTAWIRDMDGQLSPFPYDWLKRNTRKVPPVWQ